RCRTRPLPQFTPRVTTRAATHDAPRTSTHCRTSGSPKPTSKLASLRIVNEVTALAPDLAARAALRSLVDAGGVVVLSGAGLSTESGIPDYRGPTGASRKHAPMTYQTFVGDAAARQRYWARSYLGWGNIVNAQPNRGHFAVAELQGRGVIDAVITQN